MRKWCGRRKQRPSRGEIQIDRKNDRPRLGELVLNRRPCPSSPFFPRHSFLSLHLSPWLVPSKPPASRPAERPLASSWQPRLLARVPPPLVVSRSPTATAPERSPSGRLGGTRSLPSSSSASSPSSVSFARSPRTSRRTSASNLRPSWRSRSRLRRTSSRSSRTPTSPRSTPSASRSCPRTSSSRGASGESAHDTVHTLDTFPPLPSPENGTHASGSVSPGSVSQSTLASTAMGPSTSALPPVDRGRDAWLFLAGATTIEVLVWGLPFSIGVLHSYWETEMFLPGTPGLGLLTVASTLQTGLMYCSAVALGPLLTRYPHHRVGMQRLGLAASVTGIVASGFATKPWHILISIGLIYPISALLYYPAPTLLFQWFQAKGGFASGIMYSGTGAGGTVFPFILQGLITRLGYRWGLLALGIGYGVIGLAALPFIKPRIPLPPRNSAAAIRARQVDPKLFRRSTLYSFAGCILLSSLGNFVPSVFVPSFALDLHLTQNDGTLLLAVMNAASIPGLLALGWLSDRWSPRVLIALSCIGSALACLLLWGFSTSLRVLCGFVVVFGALGLSFTALWTKLITMIVRDDPNGATVVFAIFAFARGCGNIASGPISTSLLARNKLASAPGGYGVANYGSLLLYTGLTMVAGAAVGVLYRDGGKGRDHSTARRDRVAGRIDEE